jgi:hypothetical protein
MPDDEIPDTLGRTVAVCQRFIEEELAAQPWFRRLDAEPRRWDLLLLAGSAAQGPPDGASDIDLFLVLPHAVEREHDVAPVHHYRYAGLRFEVSKMATEKVLADQTRKAELFHWHRAVLLRSRSDELARAFERAASITPEQVRDRLWTALVLFRINVNHLRRLRERGEPLSFHICVSEIARLLSDALLSEAGLFCNNKWLGRRLADRSPQAYQELLALVREPDGGRAVERAEALQRHFEAVLLRQGFSQADVDHCEERHLARLTLQYE